ncbi:branched-chain amino acid ABC transporter permease [Candidatus Desantisbacteria bacterium]|nr:branched-chain amino acid ABC transporter permease [Candidatus Desantisbacteria bacterium]
MLYLKQFTDKYNKLLFLLLFVFILAIPFLPGINDYLMHILILIILYIILALGLNIVTGFTGLLNLGYVGFYGIGAYTSGLLTSKFAMLDSWHSLFGNFMVVLIIAVINGALWGIILGAPTLKLTGDYFAIVTFGFSELVILIITNEIWLTNGPMGIPGILPPAIGAYVFIGKKPFYYTILFLLFAVFHLVYYLQKSHIGRAWFAIREDEIAAESMGINIIKYKIYAFALSAAIGAMAGAFFARWMMFIEPKMFQFWESIIILCMIVMGGMGSIKGTIIGAIILTSMGEILREILIQTGLPIESRHLIYGIIMVLIMRFRPEGLWPAGRTKGELKPETAHILEYEEESYFEKREK